MRIDDQPSPRKTPRQSKSAAGTATARAALLTAAALVLTVGCTTVEDPDGVTDTTTASIAPEPAESSAAPETSSAEELAEMLIPSTHLPQGGATHFSTEYFLNQPFTMYLALNDFEADEQCQAALDAINSYQTTVTTGVTGIYEYPAADAAEASASAAASPSSSATPTAEPSPGPSVQIMIFQQAPVDDAAMTVEGEEIGDPAEPMALYRQLAADCTTPLENSAVPGASATITELDSLQAVQVDVNNGSDTYTLYTGGGSVGDHHVYISATGFTTDEAVGIFTEQIQRLEALVAPEPITPTS